MLSVCPDNAALWPLFSFMNATSRSRICAASGLIVLLSKSNNTSSSMIVRSTLGAGGGGRGGGGGSGCGGGGGGGGGRGVGGAGGGGGGSGCHQYARPRHSTAPVVSPIAAPTASFWCLPPTPWCAIAAPTPPPATPQAAAAVSAA